MLWWYVIKIPHSHYVHLYEGHNLRQIETDYRIWKYFAFYLLKKNTKIIKNSKIYSVLFCYIAYQPPLPQSFIIAPNRLFFTHTFKQKKKKRKLGVYMFIFVYVTLQVIEDISNYTKMLHITCWFKYGMYISQSVYRV